MFETRRGSRRRYVAAVSLLLATAVVADTAIWAIACHRIDGDARAAAATAGWTLSAGATRWGGWPTAAAVTLPNAALRAGPDIIPPLTWTASRATLSVSAWHPTVLTASASGEQTLTIGTAPPTPFTARTLIATIDLMAHDPVRLAATDLVAAAPDGPVTISAADLLLLPETVTVDLAGLTLPDRAGQPITPPIDRLRFSGRISPPIEPQPIASDSAQIWRANDGKVDLSAVSLRWGPLDATAHATLTLDEALQPAIIGQVTATGLAAVIARLAETGAMTRSSATAAQAMLVILAAPTGGGAVTLPITLGDGIVTIARVPVLRLAPLQWD